MAKSPSNTRPLYQSTLSDRYTYRQAITAIRAQMGCTEAVAVVEFERALFAGELRRVWPQNNDLSNYPALYEVTK